MKKIFALTLILLSFAGSASAAALGANTVSNSGAAIYGGDSAANALAAVNPLVRMSTNVSGVVNIPSPSGTPPKVGSYVIVTKHFNGSKLFGTASDSTNIYYRQSTSGYVLTNGAGGAVTDSGTGTNDAANFPIGSGWTAY